MATKPLDKMSKPELVKALKAAQKRIAKLEATIEDSRRANVVNTTYDAVHDDGESYELPDHAPPATQEHTDEHGILKPMFPWDTKPEEK